MTMAPEDLQRFLEMGTNEEELLELLRQQKLAEDDIAATRGASPTVSAGHGNVVPNIMDPISGMFERGRAQKAKLKAEGDAANNRAGANQDIKAFIESQMRGQEQAQAIFAPLPDAGKMPMPQVAPLGGPPAGGPVGPPSPGMGGPPNAAPAPSPAVAPPALPPHQASGLGSEVPTLADMPQAPVRHSPGAPGKPPISPDDERNMSIFDMLKRLAEKGGR